MQVQLKKWSAKDKMSLYNLCSTADRKYLPDRLPSPYTEKDAEFWLDFVSQAEDNDTDVRPRQPLNTELPSEVTVSGITTSVRA